MSLTAQARHNRPPATDTRSFRYVPRPVLVRNLWTHARAFQSTDTYGSLPGSGSGTGEAFFRRGSPGHSSSTGYSESGFNPARYPQQLELPAPLATKFVSPTSSTASIAHLDRSTPPDVPAKSYNDGTYRSRGADPVPSSPQPTHYDYPRYAEGYDSDELEREAILADPRGINSPPVESAPFQPESVVYPEPEPLPSAASRVGRLSDHQSSINRSDSSPESSNPFTNSSSSSRSRPASRTAPKARGVSLVDAGPVPGSEGMRVVQRSRRFSQGPTPPSQSHRPRTSLSNFSDLPTSPTSSSGMGAGSLPPGAAPPRHSMQEP